MARLGLIAVALGFAGTIAAVSLAPQEAVAAKACARTKFDTKLVADACKKGGQAEAKKEMKKFLKTAKKKEATIDCKSCHTKLAPKYELKDDALEHFKKLGGK
jgi:hypothetical protein